MDYPLGGSGAVVDALVRGLERHGGSLRLRSPVSAILLEGDGADGADGRRGRLGRCTGVRLANGEIIHAREAVISNAPVWETSRLLPPAVRDAIRDGGALPFLQRLLTTARPLDADTPTTPSFVHLHLGINGEGMDPEALVSIHHINVPEWSKLTAPQSTAFVSVPSLLDPSLAPPGCHVIHAYLPATEPYAVWEGLDRQSEEYKALKAERARPLYEAIEKFLPDVRERVVIEMIGSPLTHERYLRRRRGTYGPELQAGRRDFPGATTMVDGLFVCGDSAWPGIGVPAVAGSGIAAVHAFVSAEKQKALLDELRPAGIV